MLPGCPNHWEQHQQKFSALFEEKVVSSARPNSTRGLHKRKKELRNETSDKEGGGAQENIPMAPPVCSYGKTSDLQLLDLQCQKALMVPRC